MNPTDLANQAQRAAEHAMILAQQARDLAARGAPAVEGAANAAEPFLFLLTIFLLACFVGYYVVWNVTPALHSPLMGVTNAISSVIVVGAMLALGLGESTAAQVFGFIGVTDLEFIIAEGIAPVVMVTAFSQRDTVQRAAAAGVLLVDRLPGEIALQPRRAASTACAVGRPGVDRQPRRRPVPRPAQAGRAREPARRHRRGCDQHRATHD